MAVVQIFLMAAQVAWAASSAAQNVTFPGIAPTYVVPTAFPTSVYPSYYGAIFPASFGFL